MKKLLFVGLLLVSFNIFSQTNVNKNYTAPHFQGSVKVEDTLGVVNKLLVDTIKGFSSSTIIINDDADISKHMAIGATASISAATILSISDAITSSNSVQGILSSLAYTPTNNTRQGIGADISIQMVGAVGGSDVIGANISALNFVTAGTSPNLIALRLQVATGPGAIAPSNTRALDILAPALIGTDPTNLEGINIANQGNAGVATSAAINIEDQSGSTNNYAITTGTGNVGFGVSAPLANLHIKAASTIMIIEATSASFTAFLSIQNNTASDPLLLLNFGETAAGTGFGISHNNLAAIEKTGNGNLVIGTFGTGFLVLGTDDTEALRIDTSQNVGIGVDAETNLHILEANTDVIPTVEIEQTSTGDAALQFSIAGDSYAMGIDNSDNDIFKISYAAGAGTAVLGTLDRFVIDPDGLVGIGTSFPAALLDIVGATSVGATSLFRISNASTSGVVSNGMLINFTGSGITNARGINITTTTANTNNTGILIDVSGASGNNFGLIVDNGLSGFGQITPTAKVHIQGTGNTNATTALIVENSDGTDALVVKDDGSITTGQLNSDNLRLDGNTLSSEDVNGIIKIIPNGTGRVEVNAPGGQSVGGFASGAFHVTSTSALVNANAVITGHNLFGGNKQLWYLGSVSSSNDNIAFINRQSGSIGFNTNNISRMLIDAGGSVGIATSTPDSTLEVNGSVVVNGTQNFAVDAEASDAYVISLGGITAYNKGLMISFIANTVNTDASTLNINSLGATTIKKLHDQDTATGDIEAGQVVVCVYDGTNFQMISQIAQ